MFTAIESSIWTGKYHLLALIVLLADILINVGGVHPIVAGIDQTDFWKVTAATWSLPAELPDKAIYGMDFFVGLILAYAPEAIWRVGNNRKGE